MCRSGSPQCKVQAAAGQEEPRSTVHHRVGLVKEMTGLAVRLSRVSGGQGLSAEQVFVVGHRFKVSGSGAGPVAAQVIDLHASRDRAGEPLVHQPVNCGQSRAAPGAANLTVPGCGEVASPEDAAIWLNLEFGEDAVTQRSDWRGPHPPPPPSRSPSLSFFLWGIGSLFPAAPRARPPLLI